MSLSPAYTDIWSESDWNTSNGEAWDYLVSGLFNDAGGYYYGTSNYGDYGTRVQALFDLIDYYEEGNLTFDSLLEAIEGSGFLNQNQGLADVIRDRLMTVDTFYDYAEYNQYSDEFGQAMATGDAETIQDFINTWSNSGIGDNAFAATSGGPGMPPTPSGLPTFTPGMAQDVISMICQGSPVCAGVDICFESGQEDCINPLDIRDLWEDVVSHVYIVFGDLGIPIPDLPIPLPGIVKLPTLGNIWEKIQNTVGGIANSEENCRASVPEGENPDEYCSTTNRITRAIQEGSEEIVTKAGEVLEDVLGTVVGAVTDPVETAEKIWDWIKGAYGDDPSKAPDWIWTVIIGSEVFGLPDVQTAIEDIIGTDINDDGTIGTPTNIPFGPNNPNPECTAQGLETDENGNCVQPQFDCTTIGKFNPKDGAASAPEDCVDPCPSNPSISSEDEACLAWEDTGPTQEQCAGLGRIHVPGDAASQTPSTCGGCSDDEKTAPIDENDPMSECVGIDDPNAQEGDPCNTGAPLNAEGKIGPFGDCIPNEDADCTVEGTGEAGKIENGECVALGGTGDEIWDGKCTSPAPDATLSFAHSDAYQSWVEQCADTHCENGNPKVEGYDCFGNPTGPQKGDPCDSNNDGVLDGEIDETGKCVATPNGTDCSADPNSEPDGQGGCKCKDGFKFDDTTQNCQPHKEGPLECVNANGEATGATNYPDCNKCPDGQKFNDRGICVDDAGTQECVNANGEATGATNYPDCTQCPDGQDFNEQGICADVTGPQECAKPDGTPTGATLESGCEKCPDGYTFDFEGICQPDSGTLNCDDYNRTTNDDGSCGPCKEGYEVATSLPDEPCVPIFGGCPLGYVLDPELGECVPVTCPDGQAFCDDTGQCEDIGTCPSDPPPPPGTNTFGGGGGAGGGGMMTGQLSGYMGDPQLLSRTEFPITDFLAGLFSNLRGE